MKQRMIDYYMDLAVRTSELSRAEKLKVGAVIVTADDCVLYGWNGTVAGFDNVCEKRVYQTEADASAFTRDELRVMWPYEDENGRYYLKTFLEVLHAESNALMKLAKSTLSGRGAHLFQTHSPCVDCAKMIYQAGIVSVHYHNDYRSDVGSDFLRRCGVDVTKVMKG